MVFNEKYGVYVTKAGYVTQAENNINSKRSDRALEHYGFRPHETEGSTRQCGPVRITNLHADRY